jgi:hypothetical protein
MDSNIGHWDDFSDFWYGAVGDWPRLLLVSVSIPINIFTASLVYVWLAVIEEHSRRQNFFMEQCTDLISTKTFTVANDKKVFGLLNIFDPINLKTWRNIRKLLLDYGRRYRLRFDTNLFFTIFLVLTIVTYFVVQLIMVKFLRIQESSGEPGVGLEEYSIVISILSVEMAVLLYYVCRIFYNGARINEHFTIHKSMLKENKLVIADLLRLGTYYFSNSEPFEPQNPIYSYGRFRLREFLEFLGHQYSKENVLSHLENLLQILTEMMDELTFEEINNPYKLFAVPPSVNLINDCCHSKLAFKISKDWV